MKKYSLVLALLLVGASGVFAADDEPEAVSKCRRSRDPGTCLFKQGEYGWAAKLYEEARKAEPDNRQLSYNIGTSLYKNGDYENAVKELADAMRSSDQKLAAKAAYNLANSHYRMGEAKNEGSERIAAWREAIGYLKKAIDLDNTMDKAKKNVEIVQRKLKEELDKQKENQDQNQDNDQKQPPLSEQAKEALARALQLSKDGKYQEAKNLLEKVIAEDETAGQLNSYVQRIDDVIEIKAGRKPKAKIDASNTDNDLEVI